MAGTSVTEWTTRYVRTAPVTTAIMAVCIGAWLVTVVQSGKFIDGFYYSQLARDWTLSGPMVAHGEYGRVIGSAFMHLDISHLIVNMVMLLFIGREVEHALGSGLYTLCYLVGILGSAAAVLWMNFGVPTVGASGALFALMVLLIGVYRSRGMSLVPPIALVGANVAYSFISSGVSLWGHLGGVFVGLPMLLFINHPKPAMRWGGVAATGVVAVLAVYATLEAWL